MKPQTIKSLKRHRAAKMAKMATRAVYLQRRGNTTEMASYIGEELVALGGIYVKFLQGVMLQSEFFKHWQRPNRLNIFENLDTEIINLPELLQSELTSTQLSKIAQVQPQPFAAGSFGQVYYGMLRDNTPVIIKVIRPLVRETLEFDLRLISIFAKQFFIKLYGNIQLDVNTALKEFKQASLNETNYVAEAQFADEMYNAYKDSEKFVVPKTFTDLCTPNIIVQEYVGGVSAAQLVKMLDKGIDPHAYVKECLGSDLDEQLIALGVELIHGIFLLPRVQGDPHPGNIKLLENDQIGMIDFGISAPSPKDKSSFFALMGEYGKLYNNKLDIEELMGKFLRVFAGDLYSAFKRLHDMRDGDSSEDLTRTIGKLAKKAMSTNSKKSETTNIINGSNMLKMISGIVNKKNRFGLLLTIEDSEILRMAQTYIALVESLGRDQQVLPIVFNRATELLSKSHPELTIEEEKDMSVARAINIVTKWLERVANRDPVLFRQFMSQIRGNGNLIPNEKKEESKLKENLHV